MNSKQVIPAILALLTSTSAFAEIGVDTPWVCFNLKEKVRVEVQNVNAIEGTKGGKFLGVEIAGAAKPSIIVDNESDTGGFHVYASKSSRTDLSIATTGVAAGADNVRKGVFRATGGNSIEVACHPPFRQICGRVLKKDAATPGWALEVFNPYFPDKPDLTKETFTLVPIAVDTMKNVSPNQLACFDVTLVGTPNKQTYSVLRLVLGK